MKTVAVLLGEALGRHHADERVRDPEGDLAARLVEGEPARVGDAVRGADGVPGARRDDGHRGRDLSRERVGEGRAHVPEDGPRRAEARDLGELVREELVGVGRRADDLRERPREGHAGLGLGAADLFDGDDDPWSAPSRVERVRPETERLRRQPRRLGMGSATAAAGAPAARPAPQAHRRAAAG